MLVYLARVCRQARERAGLKQADITAAAGLRTDSTLSNFENAKAWPEQLEAIVAAYAEQTGTTPRALWRAALQAWDEENHRP